MYKYLRIFLRISLLEILSNLMLFFLSHFRWEGYVASWCIGVDRGYILLSSRKATSSLITLYSLC